jgi:replication-associated recombination protein RarA
MIINTEKKYSPKNLDEFVFPNDEARELILAYATGEIQRPLILYGSSGTGKSCLQRLLPDTIEGCGAKVDKVVCASLESAHDVHALYGKDRKFDSRFKVNERYNYKIFQEFLITNERVNNALKIEIEETEGVTLTLISTNQFSKIDSGIVSRAEVLELIPCTPDRFFPHAKRIFDSEGALIDDTKLMTCLQVVYTKSQDNRKYYHAMDAMFRQISNSAPRVAA